MTGLVTGSVCCLHTDESVHENKIQVAITDLVHGEYKVWAFLSGMYSGAYFYPEIGDEVIVGFLNHSKDTPVILGSMLPDKNHNQVPLSNENKQKAFFSYSQLSVCFDDADKSIQIKTPAGNTITLSDNEKSIQISDQNGNTLCLSSEGIELSSQKNISINAMGDISFSSGGKTSLASTIDMNISGANININAEIKLIAKGEAAAELSASGQTTIKGAMVMIN